MERGRGGQRERERESKKEKEERKTKGEQRLQDLLYPATSPHKLTFTELYIK